MPTQDLSTPTLDLRLEATPRLTLTALAHREAKASWIDAPASPLFAVHADGHAITAHTPGISVEASEVAYAAGHTTSSITVSHAPTQLRITQHLRAYDDSALLEAWLTVENAGPEPVTLTRLDSLALQLKPADAQLLYFTSDWGQEFEGIATPLDESVVLETRAGRSSKQMHPWFALSAAEFGTLSMSAAWSGNWIFRFDRAADGGLAVSGGLSDWEFSARLAPGKRIESAPVVLALGPTDDLNAVSIDYAHVGRRHWYPRNALSAKAPVEWNHWWSYEDKAIDEVVFRANVDAAAGMGFEVCTLDAGWFGPSDPDTHWYDFRGDWSLVNTTRFPSGLRALGDYTHAAGMAFGLWCEIEGLGAKAALIQQHPDLPARRDGALIGYVCFGNPAAQDWAFETLSGLVTGTGADWIKLDFNVDPGAGCNRTDHGHGAGDGLHAHITGYYRLLKRLRAAHPNVVWENCSSGGLRIDLGLQRHTDFTFLSDPDWPEHTLQLFWGASTMLAPDAMLRWTFSDWVGQKPEQDFNPRDPNLKPYQLDYYMRVGMLGVLGLSQKLPDLPDWVRGRITEHIALYKARLRRFVREADLHRLTAQPGRWGGGDRWAAFQFALPDGAEHLVYVFRLPEAEAQRRVHPRALQSEATYAIEWLSDGAPAETTGAALMRDGLVFDQLRERESALFVLRRLA